jgi:hypothetical protein
LTGGRLIPFHLSLAGLEDVLALVRKLLELVHSFHLTYEPQSSLRA